SDPGDRQHHGGRRTAGGGVSRQRTSAARQPGGDRSAPFGVERLPLPEHDHQDSPEGFDPPAGQTATKRGEVVGTLNRTERWIEQIQRLMRGSLKLDSAVERRLAKGAPLALLALKAGEEVLPSLHAYVAAREAVIRFGGEFFRKAYLVHLQDLRSALKAGKASDDLIVQVLREVRSYSRLVAETEDLAKVIPELAKIPPSALDA